MKPSLLFLKSATFWPGLVSTVTFLGFPRMCSCSAERQTFTGNRDFLMLGEKKHKNLSVNADSHLESLKTQNTDWWKTLWDRKRLQYDGVLDDCFPHKLFMNSWYSLMRLLVTIQTSDSKDSISPTKHHRFNLWNSSTIWLKRYFLVIFWAAAIRGHLSVSEKVTDPLLVWVFKPTWQTWQQAADESNQSVFRLPLPRTDRSDPTPLWKLELKSNIWKMN